MPQSQGDSRASRSKERRRHPSDSENDPKRSKFNLKLEKVSPSRSKSLSAAGASLKSFLFRKKPNKSKDLDNNHVAVSDTVPSDAPIINPMPFVVTAQQKSKSKSLSKKFKGGKNSTKLPPTQEEETEMGEKDDEIDTQNETGNGEGIMTGNPAAGSLKSTLSSKNSNAASMFLQQSNHSQQQQQQQQRFVSVPKPIPGDRVAYNDPHLHNFHLQGHSPGYIPNKKLIFRPTSYHPEQQNYSSNNDNQDAYGLSHQNNLSPYANRANYSPRGPTLAHIRGPFPPPRLIHQNLQSPRHMQQQQQQRPPPQFLRQRPPVRPNSNYFGHPPPASFAQNHSAAAAGNPNFQSHNPNPGARHPFVPSGERLSYYHNGQYLHQINSSPEHTLRNGTATMIMQSNSNNVNSSTMMQPPIPKQRKSLLMFPNIDDNKDTSVNRVGGSLRNLSSDYHEYENISGLRLQWSEHKLPRVPVPMPESHQRQLVVEHMRNISSSCNSLPSVKKNDGNGRCRSASRVSNNHSRRNDTDSSIPWFRWFVRYDINLQGCLMSMIWGFMAA
jgi:hypothetical protein